MKKSYRNIALLILLPFLLTACQGIGIFAYIATTDKIDRGELPEGLNATEVVQISKEYGTNGYYDYFSSGAGLYRRNTQNRGVKSTSWERISLPSGWSNIQSMAVSDDNLLLALARQTSDSVNLSLYFYNELSGFDQVNNLGSLIDGTSSNYKTIRLYCPNPSGDFYINILQNNGTFGQSGTFGGSTLYTLADRELDWGNATTLAGDWATNLTNAYVSSAAHNGATFLFTLINPTGKTGLLVNQNGTQIAGSPTTPNAALAWLPGISAFIMAGNGLNGSSVYVSKNGTTDWKTLSSGFIFSHFLDVSDIKTGLILAGTQSSGRSTRGNGYMEISAADADPSKWSIRTSKSSFIFSQVRNYTSSELSSQSITGLARFTDASSTSNVYVYASTASDGVWRTHANTDAGEPIWARE